MNNHERVRLLVAKDPDHPVPQVIGAYPDTTWEIIPPEEWDRWKRDTAEAFYGPDWTRYDYTEALIDVRVTSLQALFESAHLGEASVFAPKDDG